MVWVVEASKDGGASWKPYENRVLFIQENAEKFRAKLASQHGKLPAGHPFAGYLFRVTPYAAIEAEAARG
jgi:hypothetical protein